MNKFLIEYKYDEKLNAGSKARDDVREILNSIEYTNVLLEKPKNNIKKLLHLVQIKKNLQIINNGSIVLIEWPLVSKIYMKLIFKILNKKQCKKIALIHDITKLRNDKLFKNEDEIELLNKFDLIITHNSKMSKYLIENKLKVKCIKLCIFDYLYKENNLIIKENNDYNKIVFAGNLAKEKSGFLYKINDDLANNIDLTLFGANIDKSLLNPNIKYLGSVPPKELPNRLKGFWGLIWDGNSINKCDGILGEYLKYNNPHKASLYLSAGIPIIVWKESALSDFVYKNEVGIVIKNLNELKSINFNKKLYEKYEKNAIKISEKLRMGYYTKKSIQKCENILY